MRVMRIPVAEALEATTGGFRWLRLSKPPQEDSGG
jgi:hypothetical protein